MSIAYVIIASLGLIKTINSGRRSVLKEETYNLIEIIIAIFIAVSFFIVISELYPNLANVPGTDIVRHYSASKALILTPDIYESEYPWFHFPLAVIVSLSNPPVWLFQTGLSIISILLLFSFYAMANIYLRKIDRRAPMIATILFFLFSGLGWLYSTKDLGNSQYVIDPFRQLSASNVASYWDVGFGESPWLWFWFRPISIGFTAVFFILSLLPNLEISNRKYILIVSVSIVTLIQVHIPELIIVILLFLALTLLKSNKFRLKHMQIGAIIGGISSLFISTLYSPIMNNESMPKINLTVIPLIVVSIVSLILLKYRLRIGLYVKMNERLYVSIFLFVYSVGLLTWYYNIDINSISNVIQSLAVPWEFYPELLGVVGILAIPGSVIVIRRSADNVSLFLILLILVIVIGRLVTLINVSVQDTGYWERRLIPFAYFSASILASIFLVRALDFIKSLKKFWSILIAPITITVLVLVGILSTFLSLEYQIISAQTYALTASEKLIQSSLQSIDPRSVVLTLNEREKNVFEYGNRGYLIGYYRYQMWPSVSPEIPLQVLSVLNGTSVIYLSEKDLNSIPKLGYQNGYIASHLIPSSNKSIGNTTIPGVIKLPFMAPPVSSSPNVLVLPEKRDKIDYYAYDILSLGNYNYTTASISDISTLRNASSLIVPNEQLANHILAHRSDYGLSFKKLIILNFKDYGSLSKVNGTGDINSKLNIKNNSVWKGQGIGSGSIGKPEISYSSIGDNELKISVGKGIYSLWELSRKFEIPLNISSDSSLKFDWFGRGDGKWYVIELSSGDSKIWYRFMDLWKGWKTVILPIKTSDSSGTSFGTIFNRVTTGLFNLSSVTNMNIRTESLNRNQDGQFLIKKIEFLKNITSNSIAWNHKENSTDLFNILSLYPIELPKGFEPRALYNNTNVLFSAHKMSGGYEIIYFNLLPLVISPNNTPLNTYSSIGHLLNILGADLTHYEAPEKDVKRLVSGGVTSFSMVRLLGNITMKSESISINNSGTSIAVTNDNSIVKDVVDVIPIYTDQVILSSKDALSEDGTGFYSKFLVNSSVINFVGPTLINIKTKSGQSLNITGNGIAVTTDKAQVVLRQPQISLSGTAKFSNFYAYGELSSKLRSLGQNLTMNGKIFMVNDRSDKFTVTKSTSFSGTHERSPPIYGYSDFANIMNIFNLSNIKHIFAIAIIIVIFNVYVFRRKETI